MATKHRVFISYHHKKDQREKNALLTLNKKYEIFIDGSVDTGDIDENLPDETIRQKIRDEYLKDTTVTILLVGVETAKRKHIDWELYSSMYNGKVNKQSGILVIQLPSTKPEHFRAAHGDKEKNDIYPDTSWTSIGSKAEYKSRYPYLPDRIIDNLLESDAKISVAKWDDLVLDKGENFTEDERYELIEDKLENLIEYTFQDRQTCNYDLSRRMRRNNS